MRINIPTNPDQLIKLALAIVAQHKKLGTASPLNNIEDIEDFEPQANAADSANGDAKDFAQKSEQATEARDNALGPDTITPGGVRFFVTASREVLAAVNKGSEHKLGDWGLRRGRHAAVRRESGKGRGQEQTGGLSCWRVRKHTPASRKWRGSFFGKFRRGDGARGARTRPGDDGNRMPADGKFYPQISRMTQMKKKSVQSA